MNNETYIMWKETIGVDVYNSEKEFENDTVNTDDSITLQKEILRIDDPVTSTQIVSSKRSKKSTEKQIVAMSKKDEHNMCVCNGTVSDQNQVRCNWCQSWFHERCVGIGKDDPVVFWACTECRCVPLMVRTINEKLDEVLKVNQSIVQELNNKTTELQLLQTENILFLDNKIQTM